MLSVNLLSHKSQIEQTNMSENTTNCSFHNDPLAAQMNCNNDGVEIIAVVPPKEPEPEPRDIHDVAGDPCPICLEDIPNGSEVVVMGCNGKHWLCRDCCHDGCEA